MSVINRSAYVVTCVLAVSFLTIGLKAADPAAGRSPFLPPTGPTESAAPTSDSTLELRGIMAVGDSFMFSVYDSGNRMSAWSRLNEGGHSFAIRSHDVARDSVTVDYQGRTVTLALRTAKVASAPVNQPQAIPAAQAAPQPVGGPVVLNPSPADEQRRLEAIAAEVNRRRMIRQQALQASRQAAGQPNQPQNAPNSSGTPNQQRR